mgnify:CR=1 FL=1
MFFFSDVGFADLQVDATSSTIEHKSAIDILETGTPGLKCKFSGKLVWWDTAPRSIPVRRQSPNSPKKQRLVDSLAMDMIVLDATGPVMVTIFGSERCTTFVREVQQIKSPYVSFSILRIAALGKTEWNGRCLTRIHCLQSIEEVRDVAGTVCSITSENGSPFRTSTYRIPITDCCINQFSQSHLVFAAPFRASFVGIVMNIQDAEYSQQGNLKRSFYLVDAVGDYLQCSALGQNAQNVGLRDKQHVVLYYATGRPPASSNPGIVLVMKDAFIVPCGEVYSVPPLRNCIDISEYTPSGVE